MKILSILFLIIICNLANSQDLIVTEKSDSLNCKITSIKNGYIYFTFRYEKEIRKTLLPVSQVKFHQKDFFSYCEISPDEIRKSNYNNNKYRTGGYGGWSNMTAKVSNKIPAELGQYIEELKSGYHLGGDFIFYGSGNIGFGVKYSRFRTSNQLYNIQVRDTVTGQVLTGRLSDNITLQYLGPSMGTRISSADKKTSFISDISLGYIAFKNKATLIDDFIITSKSYGLRWDFGFDFLVEENLTLGLFFTYNLGTLDEFTYETEKQSKTIKLENGNGDSISRIDLSIGLRWVK